MNQPEQVREQLNRLQNRSLAVGTVGAIALAAGALLDTRQFFQSYLLGFQYWLAVSLGSMGLVMLHHLVGGGWSFLIRRPAEAAARTIPLLLIFFIPLLLGTGVLYPWTHPEEVAASELLQHKTFYLNLPFFLVRAAFYFLIWIGLASILSRWSLRQDRTGDLDLTLRLKKISGIGIVLYGLTLTFASIDWMMSLEPDWFSTIYGLQILVGHGLAAVAFLVVMVHRLSGEEPLSRLVSRRYYHDWGNLMLAFVMLWAYLSFSQYLIIWSGNLPEEISWYLHRTYHGWQFIAIVLLLFHFAIPFLVLLSRQTKRAGETLVKVAVALLVMRFVDFFWIIKPSFSTEGFSIHWLDVAAPIALGGFWMAAFAWQLKRAPLMPVQDPRLEEAFGHQEVVSHG